MDIEQLKSRIMADHTDRVYSRPNDWSNIFIFGTNDDIGDGIVWWFSIEEDHEEGSLEYECFSTFEEMLASVNEIAPRHGGLNLADLY